MSKNESEVRGFGLPAAVSSAKRVLLGVACCLSLFGATHASGQMVTAERMTDFGKTFDVKPLARSTFDAVQVATNIPSNILWPGDQPTWTIQLQNPGATPIKCVGKIDVVQYGTHGVPGEIWIPTTFKIADVGSVPIKVDLPAHGFQDVTVSPHLPETFGGYAIVADLGAAGRQFVFGAARTFKPTLIPTQFPCMSLDDGGVEKLSRLGIQAVRRGVAWVKPGTSDYAEHMAALDAKMQEDMKNHITVMLMVMPSPVAQPLDRSRPHLDDQGVMLNTKSDSVWLPAEDDAFQQWVTTVTSKYGWPRGPVTAMSLWNEPWEGISISGWGADMLRFREIFRHMAHGIIEARQKADVQVLVAGCDSSTNTIDKLFPDDSDEFLPLLDVCTIHYQGMNSPATFRKFLNRSGPNGRIKIWDTESWVANVDDRVAACIAANKSAGYDRTMGVFAGNIWDDRSVKVMLDGGKTERRAGKTVWSTAASVGAAVHFIGDRKFNSLLFQNGLPWVLTFDGLPKVDAAGTASPQPEDGTIVAVGDLGDEFGKNNLLYRDIVGTKQIPELKAAKTQLAALPADAPAADRTALLKQVTALSIIRDSTLTFDDAGGKFTLFDFYGNPVPAKGHRIIVPLDGRGFFLRSDGTAGSFAALTDAVKNARIDGFEYLQMIPHDLLDSIESMPSLRVTCTNVLNRPVSGKLTGSLGKLQIRLPERMTFAANETRDIEIKILGGEASADNAYPLSLKYDAGTDGSAEHDETMHVNVIARRTITVDGKLDDWNGVLPQAVTSDVSAAPSVQEAAWFPFQKFHASVKSGVATGYVAYDENNFYFAAKVADADPDGGTMRFETRDDDQFFYPDIAYELDPAQTFATKAGKLKNDSRKLYALQTPGGGAGADDRCDQTIESVVKAMKFKVHVPPGKSQQVSLYLLDDDDYELGRRNMEILATDTSTGKELDKRRVKAFGQGCYMVYHLSGDVEFTLTNSSFLDASIAGLFFDDDTKSADGGASARFVKRDDETQGRWQGVYGTNGFVIPGTPPNVPPGQSVEFSQAVAKKAHDWPAGVRHFSYRKKPTLPAGDYPGFDNVQIAFNAIPLADDPVVTPNPPGTPPMYTAYRDTDYEFALNKVADEYGGGTEIWRLMSPDHQRVNFFPREPKAAWQGAVKRGKLVVSQDGGTRITEVAIPWDEIPDVKHLMDAGKPLKFDFRVNDHHGVSGMELARDRGVSRVNNDAFGVPWVKHWANEVEFAFQKSRDTATK